MMWQAVGWAGSDNKTSSPSVVMPADKSKPLKFNICVCGEGGGTPQRDEYVGVFHCT